MRRAARLIHTSEKIILINITLITLVLIFVNVKTLIMLMLFFAASDLHDGPCRQVTPAIRQLRNLNIHL